MRASPGARGGGGGGGGGGRPRNTPRRFHNETSGGSHFVALWKRRWGVGGAFAAGVRASGWPWGGERGQGGGVCRKTPPDASTTKRATVAASLRCGNVGGGCGWRLRPSCGPPGGPGVTRGGWR